MDLILKAWLKFKGRLRGGDLIAADEFENTLTQQAVLKGLCPICFKTVCKDPEHEGHDLPQRVKLEASLFALALVTIHQRPLDDITVRQAIQDGFELTKLNYGEHELCQRVLETIENTNT